MSETLSEIDRAVIRVVVGRMLDGGEDPRLKLSVRCSAVAVDRWGRDLERDPGEQEWSHFEQVVEETAADLIHHYADDDAHVEGVDGYVFEGRPIDVEELSTGAIIVTHKIEQAGDFDRNSPGGIVEPVEEEGSA